MPRKRKSRQEKAPEPEPIAYNDVGKSCGNHHCWQCHKAASMRCIRKGHLRKCTKHNRFTSKSSECRDCTYEAKFGYKKPRKTATETKPEAEEADEGDQSSRE
ncbi:hypothetical protein N7454_008845 [Penicillium verhagenii]|nr:hypothetical protein N7454_008845 [Penicillium verhagenii]